MKDLLRFILDMFSGDDGASAGRGNATLLVLAFITLNAYSLVVDGTVLPDIFNLILLLAALLYYLFTKSREVIADVLNAVANILRAWKGAA